MVDSDDDSSDSDTDDETATVASNEINSANAEQYYTSGVTPLHLYTSTPAACLPYYFNHARNTTKTACIYVINDKTVAFIPIQNGITVFDSHYHGTSGAFLAMAPTGAEWELLSWFKSINSIPHSLGTVTNVTFR